jgi:hypothetical protein
MAHTRFLVGAASNARTQSVYCLLPPPRGRNHSSPEDAPAVDHGSAPKASDNRFRLLLYARGAHRRDGDRSRLYLPSACPVRGAPRLVLRAPPLVPARRGQRRDHKVRSVTTKPFRIRNLALGRGRQWLRRSASQQWRTAPHDRNGACSRLAALINLISFFQRLQRRTQRPLPGFRARMGNFFHSL